VRGTSGFALLGVLAILSCSPRWKKGGIIDSKSFSPGSTIALATLEAVWMEGRCQWQWQASGQGANGQAIIRIRRDSAVWISVRKLGFEAARLLVAKDSVHLLDRLNRQFQSFDIAQLKDRYHVPGDLLLLQDLLLGNAPGNDPGAYQVRSIEAETVNLDKEVPGGRIEIVWDSRAHQLKRVSWGGAGNGPQLQMALDGYKDLESKRQFSYFRTLKVSSAETGEVSLVLSFQQLQLDVPLSLRMEIPAGYSNSH